MAFAESSVGDAEGAVVEIYRVRVCTRCGHAACPCCGGSWCDLCFDGADAPECLDGPSDDFKVNKMCADEMECTFEEPESEAVVLLRTETRAEFEARTARDDE